MPAIPRNKAYTEVPIVESNKLLAKENAKKKAARKKMSPKEKTKADALKKVAVKPKPRAKRRVK